MSGMSDLLVKPGLPPIFAPEAAAAPDLRD